MKMENVARAAEVRRDLAETENRLKRLEEDRTRACFIRYSTDAYGNNCNSYQVFDPTLRELVFFAILQQTQKTRAAQIAELKTLGVEV